MSERSIFCKDCSTSLGTIRDARLRKDIVYFCTPCDNRRNEWLSQLADKNQRSEYGGDFSDIFGDVFGDIFGGKK